MNDLQLWAVSAVAIVLLLMANVVLWYQMLKRYRQINALKLIFQEQQREMAGLKKEIHELRCGTLGVDNRIEDIAEKLTQTIARQDKLAQVNHDPQTKLYGHAMKMIELGATVEDLIKECDLARAEAELLVSLHGKSGA